MNIVVLCGGLSPERDVSLSSGALIGNALLKNNHSVCMLDLYLGCDIPKGGISKLFKKGGKPFKYVVPKNEPDLKELEKIYGSEKIGKNVLEICKYSDIVFLGLHGDIGENGKLQKIFEDLGIRYTGSDSKSSMLAMDKGKSKDVFVKNGILTPKYVIVRKGEEIPKFDIPCVVKPLDCGSSVGVRIVRSKGELDDAVREARRYSDDILVEEYVKGREFSVGILNGEVLPSIEIIPKKGFYDYKNKYQKGASIEVCPSNLTQEQETEVRSIALRVHNILGLGSYSRIDFLLSDTKNKFFCLEANTLPGMTPTSLLPQEAMVVGISFEELCERVVENMEK